MSLKYEPSSEPLLISAKQLFLDRELNEKGFHRAHPVQSAESRKGKVCGSCPHHAAPTVRPNAVHLDTFT